MPVLVYVARIGDLRTLPASRRAHFRARILEMVGMEEVDTAASDQFLRPITQYGFAAGLEVSLSISPIKSLQARPSAISKVARDITDQQDQAGAAAADRGASPHLRDLAGSDRDATAGEFLVQISPSSEAILGYRPEEMIGRSGVDFIHPDHLENSRQEMRAARRGQRPKISDTRYIHKDGRQVWLSWLGTWSEPAKRFFFVGRDMTESRLAQETLRESEAARARHHRHRARRLRPDRREGRYPGLECAGRKYLRLAAR